MFTRLLMFTYHYSCLPKFPTVYLCLPMFATVNSCLFTYFYPYLLVFAYIFLCLSIFRTVSSLPMFTTVYSCVYLFNHVYSCLTMFTLVYLCLNLFTCVYLCFIDTYPGLHFVSMLYCYGNPMKLHVFFVWAQYLIAVYKQQTAKKRLYLRERMVSRPNYGIKWKVIVHRIMLKQSHFWPRTPAATLHGHISKSIMPW